jgi:predicted RNase H-like HicB family nuclease
MSAEISPGLERRAEQIAAMPYTYTVVLGEDGIWTSQVLEVPGVFGEGDDPSEAVASARDGLEDVAISLIEEGREVPTPFGTRQWSGDLRVRLTPTLHQRATTLAAEQGVSLNRWLSAAVGLAGAVPRSIEQSGPRGIEPAIRAVSERAAEYDSSSGGAPSK